MNTQYHRLTLSPHDRIAYDKILKKSMECGESISFDKPECEVKRVIECVMYDNPYFTFRKWMEIIDKNTITIIPEYRQTRNQFMTTRKKCNEISKSIIKDVNGDEYEKAKKIHDILCKRLKYSDDGPASHSVVGPLMDSKGVCEGFSYLCKLLMEMVNIECVTTLGEYRGKCNHMWNCIRIDKKWYHVDITADLEKSDRNYPKKNFLLSTNEIRKDLKLKQCLFKCDNKFNKECD